MPEQEPTPAGTRTSHLHSYTSTLNIFLPHPGQHPRPRRYRSTPGWIHRPSRCSISKTHAVRPSTAYVTSSMPARISFADMCGDFPYPRPRDRNAGRRGSLHRQWPSSRNYCRPALGYISFRHGAHGVCRHMLKDRSVLQ